MTDVCISEGRRLQRLHGGKLLSYSYPGSYPVFYSIDEGPLCPDCADKDGNIDDIIGLHFNLRDRHLRCCGCGKRIESAHCDEDEYDEDEYDEDDEPTTYAQAMKLEYDGRQ